MHFDDLSPYSYTKMTSRASLRNVGWLTTEIPFATGIAPPGLVEQISRATRNVRNPMRGIEGCAFCGHEHIREVVAGETLLLGMSEIWIPSPTNEVVYISPSLLIHYVMQHQYQPPGEFVRAVESLSPDPDEWDTPHGAYRKLVRRFGD